MTIYLYTACIHNCINNNRHIDILTSILKRGKKDFKKNCYDPSKLPDLYKVFFSNNNMKRDQKITIFKAAIEIVRKGNTTHPKKLTQIFDLYKTWLSNCIDNKRPIDEYISILEAGLETDLKAEKDYKWNQFSVLERKSNMLELYKVFFIKNQSNINELKPIILLGMKTLENSEKVELLNLCVEKSKEEDEFLFIFNTLTSFPNVKHRYELDLCKSKLYISVIDIIIKLKSYKTILTSIFKTITNNFEDDSCKKNVYKHVITKLSQKNKTRAEIEPMLQIGEDLKLKNLCDGLFNKAGLK